MDTIARVRRAFHIQGWSMKKISRDLHVSRNTVRKILRSGQTAFTARLRFPSRPKHYGRMPTMTDSALNGCHVLVVEDDYLLAEELQSELEEAGAVVVGPISRVVDASVLIETGRHLDGAILDANLGGEMVFP